MRGAGGEAYVLQPGEGRLIDLGAFSMSVKASADETDGTFTLLEADEPPDSGRRFTYTTGSRRAFCILEGEYFIFLDENEFPLPGRVVHIHPAETPDGFRVGEVVSRKLNIQIGTRHSLEVIGPVPEAYL